MEIINNGADGMTFDELKSGDVFIKDKVAYIKVEPNYSVDYLVEYLYEDTLDNIEELPRVPDNAIMLGSGVSRYFGEEETVVPVKKATLTLDY